MSSEFLFHFSKTGAQIYISHLDLMRLLGRAARRADLPVELTKGFNPRLKLKLARALKLGIASESEEGEMTLSEFIEPVEIQKRFQAQLPSGIEIKDVVSK